MVNPASSPPRETALLLGSVLGAMALALLLPVTFSDPNSIDPYAVRLAALSSLLLAASWWRSELRPARALCLAVAAFTVPYSVWTGTPQILAWVMGDSAPSGIAAFFWGNAAAAVVTAALCALALRARLVDRAALRLRPTMPSVVLGIAGVALLVAGALAIPAELLGRVALQPILLGRLAPWLIPGDLIQGAVQEVQFRGVLLGVLEQRMTPRMANVTQAVLFGLAHLTFVYQGPEAFFVPLTVVLGWIFGYVTRRTNSLWAAVIVHAVADVLVDVAIVPGLYGYQ